MAHEGIRPVCLIYRLSIKSSVRTLNIYTSNVKNSAIAIGARRNHDSRNPGFTKLGSATIIPPKVPKKNIKKFRSIGSTRVILLCKSVVLCFIFGDIIFKPIIIKL